MGTPLGTHIEVQLRDALEVLRRGEIVCFPTESTYGLAVDISNPAALNRLAALKGRGQTAPFGLLVKDLEAARQLADAWPARARAFAERYWPGPLTLVIPACASLSPHIVGESGGVGVRQSSHPIAHQLAATFGPITATSANPSGSPPAKTIKQAQQYFGDRVSAYIDGGFAGNQVSTVVAFSNTGSARLIRQGAITISLSSET